MCGICGIVGPQERLARLPAMVAALHHRGPDDAGTYRDGVIALGHTRLSILDLSPAGHQPMHDASGRLTIVFNGEIYNYLELREELAGYPFRTQTDTEVILAAYKAWGVDCLRRFNGMWAFAIHDKEQDLLFCARDRIGVKPFFYARDRAAFLFASEIKALLAADVPRRPNHRIISDFLVDGHYDHTTATFFEGISQLAAGHYMIVRGTQVRIHQYWDLPERTAPVGLEEAKARIRELLEDAVRIRLRADVPVGVHLSAGLDSSTMVLFANKALERQGRLETFSMCFRERQFDEGRRIRQLLPLLRCSANFSYLTCAEASAMIEEVVRQQDQPFAGVPTIAYTKMDKLARQRQVLVMLEGQGSDELFAGYAYYQGPRIAALLKRMRLIAAARSLRRSAEGKGAITAARALLRSLRAQRRPIAQDGTVATRPACLRPDYVARHYRRPSLSPRSGSTLGGLLYRDLRHTKLPKILRMNDHASMHSGIEVRFPFLDYRLVEYAFSLPDDLKIHDGVQKFVLREMMAQVLPERIRTLPKIAVQTPQQQWMKGCLRSVVDSVISSESFAARGIFDVAKVREEFERYLADDREQNSFALWQWVSLELWFRAYIDAADA